ncbi:HepA Superfamily II DNA/RNA helicases, SNF2 family [uncultured Caudovirales phage]|uniref:HepA Superfamily II DNA/RNA helicases, SNF2 family n=1 Tax=uncultured Caudovirales phage TaxID=2100421 RepID=A0A6J7VK62_9CAUD|nr:HepA Superfamily II DNA/RNA helicases, SNF2 family [uncultured Caudovirales phage]
MKFTPKIYQQQAIERILLQERVGLWAGMGLGKTSATLTAIDILQAVEPGPVLVLAPLRVARNTWPDEAKKWDHLQHMRIQPIVGDPKQRRAALSKVAEVYTMNYDNLPWLAEHFGESWPFATIVADESTRLKSFRLQQGGKRAGALRKIAHTQVKRFIELTGTPSPNGMIDLWGQLWFLDKGKRLGKSFSAFSQRWFRQIPNGSDYPTLEIMKHSQREIEAAVADLCISIDPKDYFDLKEPIVTMVPVTLPEKAREAYDEMHKEMVAELNGHQVEAFSAAAKTMKLLQLANGAIYTDDKGSWTEAHKEKLEALASVIEEAAGAPVLVAYHFKSDLARLKKAFPYGREFDTNPKTLRDWNAGKIELMFVHPASAGHGLSMQDGGNILAFFCLNWNLEEHQQIIERIGPVRQAQAGHDRPVFLYYIIATDTVEELMLERLKTKRSVQDLLLEATKR